MAERDNMQNLKIEDEIRCRRCGRLLMKGHVRLVEVKCPKCGFIQVIASQAANK